MTLLLTHSDVASLLRPGDVLDAVERAHADLAQRHAQSPAPVALTGSRSSTFLPMTATWGGLVGVKLLADLPANAGTGRPTQRSTVMITSEDTGECLALIDGRLITAIRTAATSAVATKHLARPGSRVLGLVGAGNLAVEHTRALAAVRPLDTVVIWSRSTETVERFRAQVADLALTVKPLASVEEVVKSCDVLCTLTPSREPVVQGAWFTDGLHINAVGAPPRADHREVDGHGLARAHVVLDSLDTALTKSGEVRLALQEGLITHADLATELGDVVAGLKPGRTDDGDITLFNSVGLGLQDVATARLLLDRAAETRTGTVLDLSA
jgi:alanine dehydrogenase